MGKGDDRQDSEKTGSERAGPRKRSKKDTVEIDRFRSNLLSIVSHELNTPLTGILNSITILEEKYPDEGEYLPMLRRNAERLRRTIDNLLEISRVDAGTLRVRLSEFDMRNFLLARRESLRSLVEKARFQLDLNLEEDLPHACGDIKRLGYVFDSLVLNAVKFSNVSVLEKSAQGEVAVSLSLEPASSLPPGLLAARERKTGMYIITTVQSSLPSMGESPEHFEQLFEPFSPWRDADTRVKEGLGVELAIAKEILLAHEGFIWAGKDEENPRKGWKFSFALPLLSRMDELDLVINNRIFTAIGALSKMTLLLLRPEPGIEMKPEDQPVIFRSLQKALFRSSDSTFWMQDTGEFVILMDDCEYDAGERVAERLVLKLKKDLPQFRFLWSLATGPDHGSNAQELLEKARSDWRPNP